MQPNKPFNPVGILLLAAVLAFALPAHAEEFSFDAAAFEKSPFEWKGYLELKQEHQALDTNAALYRLNFADSSPTSLDRSSAALELSGSYRRGATRFYGTGHAQGQHDALASSGQTRLYEGYVAHEAAPGMTFEAGKKSLKWGKGYAWNPVAFLDRPKDPVDPELSREGYVVADADFVHSGGGALRTLAFTPVVMPVGGGLNHDFGPAATNLAAKLYLLYRDVDIDLIAAGGGSRPGRAGFDFSTNLATNFEIHGEYAYTGNYLRPRLTAAGIQRQRLTAQSWLLGLRYLTAAETTWIAEFYHDDRGYSRAQMQAFYDRVDATPPDQLPTLTASAQTYMRPNAMQNYGYLRIVQKDAFGLLYFNPALTLIRNLDDGSSSLTPELLYTGIDNLELRLRATLLLGARHTEFGEKANDSRVELRARYYF